MKISVFHICCLFILLFNSCQRARLELTPEEYIKYLDNPENGFIKKVTLDDIVYEFHCKTPEYLAVQQNLNSANASFINPRIKQLQSTIWFYVYIKSKSGKVNPLKEKVSGLDEYNQRLSYFLDQAKSSFNLSSGGKPMKQVAYHFENNYGLSPFDTMILGYAIEGDYQEIILEYEDRLFNAGLMKITIEENDLNELPTLKL